MPGGSESFEIKKVFLLEDLRNETHILADLEGGAISCGDACTFLSPMLQRIEPKKGYSGDIF